MTAQSIAATKVAVKVRCHQLRIERAAGFTMCVDCRRPLFPFPKNKCKAHAVYGCNECFSLAQIAEFAWQRSGAAYDVEEAPTDANYERTNNENKN